MQLKYTKECIYNLIEDSKIETSSGAFYRAQDLSLRRTVAVKSVHIEGNTQSERDRSKKQAMEEVCAMVRLESKGIAIPRIYDAIYDQDRNTLFIMMEWIYGRPLTENMRGSELQFIQWMVDLCNILSVMEKAHIYHKDIKPDNIMITEQKKLYLIDFNISLSTPNLEEGTIHYKAPEMGNRSVYVGREKVDMFSIGVVLYEYYTGNVPKNPDEYARNRTRGKLEWDKYIEPKAKNQTINDLANRIIIKCMKLNPSQRYSSYSELKNDLIKLMRGLKCKKQR